MERAEADLAIAWAAAEGWNPGLHDAARFFACDPHGFFVGESDGRPVALISAVAYDATFGFLGLYIVRPAERGKGYGMAVWNAAIAHLGDRTVGLDGVVERQGDYRKSGFVFAHRNVRYEGVGGGTAAHADVHPAADLPFEALAAYDARMFPCARRSFLKAWIDQPGGAALALCRRGRVEGYGVIRPCRRGFKIGPLFADEADGAEILFAALASGREGQPLFLDLPQPNNEAVALATRHGMRPVFETARMYKGAAPNLPLSRIYGITTFELG